MPDDRLRDRAWFTRHPVMVAWDLIGCILRVERDGAVVAGRIVETEAYAGPADPASHASRLRVAREVMAGAPGTVYTYRSYGIHTMMNIVSHEVERSGGVLIRAVEPIDGIDVMRARRELLETTRLANGPGSLGQAMGIRLDDIGADLIRSEELSLWPGRAAAPIHAGPRIGISRAVLAPWRFFEHPSPFVSRHRRGAVVERHELHGLIPPAGTPIE
jgi:DNA-3-methyladenine glycosylase